MIEVLGWPEAVAIIGSVVGVAVTVCGFLYGIYVNKHKRAQEVEATEKELDDVNDDIRTQDLEIEKLKSRVGSIEKRQDEILQEIRDAKQTIKHDIEKMDDKVNKFVDALIQYFTNKDRAD